jgi:uncharacterized protein YndB with AHSA1/START domain
LTEAANPDFHEIAFTKVLDAPRDKVFRAWVERERFSRWWGGEGCTTPLDTVTIDARDGGQWTATMIIDDGGMEIPFHGVYQEIREPEYLAFTLIDPKDAGERAERGEAEGEAVTVTLKDLDGKTELTFVQSGHLDASQLEEAKAGWESMIDSLGAYAASS